MHSSTVKRLQSLTSFQKQVLAIYALYQEEPLGQKRIYELLKEHPIRKEYRTAVEFKEEIKKAINQLKRGKWLATSGYSGYELGKDHPLTVLYYFLKEEYINLDMELQIRQDMHGFTVRWQWQQYSTPRARSMFLCAIYFSNINEFDEALGHFSMEEMDCFLEDLHKEGFDLKEMTEHLPFIGQYLIFAVLVELNTLYLLNHDWIIDLATEIASINRDEINDDLYSGMHRHLGAYYFLKGDFPQARNYYEKITLPEMKEMSLQWLSLMEGKTITEERIKILKKQVSLYQQRVEDKKDYPPYMEALAYPMMMLLQKDSTHLKAVITYANKYKDDLMEAPYQGIKRMSYYLQHEKSKMEKTTVHFQPYMFLCFEFVPALMLAWSKPQAYEDHYGDHASLLLGRCVVHGYRWMAVQLYMMMREIEVDIAAPIRKQCEEWKTDVDFYLIDRFEAKSPWEEQLDFFLNEFSATQADAKGAVKEEARVVYILREGYGGGLPIITPKEQKILKSGKWGKGKRIGMQRFMEKEVMGMTEQDKAIANSVEVHVEYGGYGWGGTTTYEFEAEKTLPLLAGHPYIFREDRGELTPVTITLEEPTVTITSKNGMLEMSISPKMEEGSYVVWQKNGSFAYKVYKLGEAYQKFAAMFQGKKTWKIPEKGAEKLQQVVEVLSKGVTVNSEVEGLGPSLPEVPADTTPRVHFVPTDYSFSLSFLSKPFTEGTTYLPLGIGDQRCTDIVHGEKVQTVRNLKQEQKMLDKLLGLSEALEKNKERTWELEDRYAVLEVMQQLLPLQEKGEVIIEWPQGAQLQLGGTVDTGQVQMGIKGINHWFEVEGEVQVDEQEVIQLMELLKKYKGHRFVELSYGKFVALTEKMERSLQALSELTHGGEQMRMPMLKGAGLQDVVTLLPTQADEEWKAYTDKMNKALGMKPRVPATLQASLRPYQQEGYQWLVKLSEWGVGACLADDMGLGKTIQTLALLLKRASKGPALVIAPASVVNNWVAEGEQFAPSLNFQMIREGNREEVIEKAKAKDVLLCTYNIAQIEQEHFSQKQFSTIVLDEAQAIKNRNAKRTKAILKLQGDFKLALTGTPMENHLGELWSLFHFINPTLLGSHDAFVQHYTSGEVGQKRLKRAIQPFILRRRKDQVLKDLPPKTDITLHLELSSQQRTFYEAVRQNALSKLEGMEEGQGAVEILAELTRLRRACCHPLLLDGNTTVSSPKIEALQGILSELKQNGHRALIFSQFVSFLDLVKEFMEEEGYSYCYLDGSTPVKKRQGIVDEFQQGDADFFLISLKAGGTGLNLTAADYVIHLDPWWNPAVEDQASDRAHRIGQDKPVTVYRLVTKDTIEDKIIQLHHQKRDLADQLLEGTEASAKMSAKDILALMQEG
ncbi:DEAD/DEAH box helicase [Algivirga pacifica]|uniref:Superfamily II DNA or RNA helicase, SNF2 family n=1 Tax=Algivirga pacifica TaxID=1162670 RepID=A0ABP9DQS7_9BACT